jgi:exodeoxyribonuclease VII large subunit
MADRLKIYTVAQVNGLVKQALESGLPPRFIVRGQIRDWKHHSSGHCYFSLKDENGILPGVMWASRFKTVKFAPENGLEVLVTGHIDVYTAGGKYQLYAEKLEPKGVGGLQLAFEQMVARLQAEGLFLEDHKQPLPVFPGRIGVLTSRSGAALHDIEESICQRWVPAQLFLYPVPVQGEGAAAAIAVALKDCNARNDVLGLDLLIVGRGGGSQEDLWAFNEEVLARAMFDSVIPIISAVGHEVDVTIADLVADARASTPTKAGVVAVPDGDECLELLLQYERRLRADVRAHLDLGAAELRTVLASDVFKRPTLALAHKQQQLDELALCVRDALEEILIEWRHRLTDYYEQVAHLEPHRLLGRRLLEVNTLETRAQRAMSDGLHALNLQLQDQASHLTGMNPKSVLKRGYSITHNTRTDQVVQAEADVRVGDLLRTELAQENFVESLVRKQ